MKKGIRRILAGALSLFMMLGVGTVSVFAADGAPPYADDYIYTAKLKITTEEPVFGFTTALFDTDVYMTVNHKLGGEQGYNCHIHSYIVETIPKNGVKEPIQELVLRYNNSTHHHRCAGFDHTERTFDVDSAGYGIQAGDYLMAAPLTFGGDQDVIKLFAKGVPGYYTFSENQKVYCTLQVTDFVLVRDHGKPVTPEVKPDETRTQAMQLTAEIAAPAPTYKVTIPESVAMGTLSAETDNETAYTVAVTAENLGSGRVEVSAPEAGELHSSEHALAYTNHFGTQATGVSKELQGSFTVTAADVAAAAAGNYTGTADFAIRYFAAE